jgi:hypothetical protein
VVRNPYDVISTMAVKTRKRERTGDLERCADFAFLLFETVLGLKAKIPEADLFEVRHEEFLLRPRETLASLCGFLGVEATADYLDACTEVVFPVPHRSRFEIPWPRTTIAEVRARMDSFPFLRGYAYGDSAAPDTVP